MTTTDARPTSRIVHVNDNVPDAVYIGRSVPRKGLKASKWANPFRTDVHGRRMAILMYRDYLRSSGTGWDLLVQIEDLRGKPLACWCRHDGEERTSENVCHGDVLIELMGAQDDD